MLKKNYFNFLILILNITLLTLLFNRFNLNTNSKISYLIFSTFVIIHFVFLLFKMKKDRENMKNNVKSNFDRSVKKLFKNRNSFFGLIIVLILVYIVMLAPLLTSLDPLYIDWGAINQGPSDGHIFGTDELGRDILARVLYGSRNALGIGVLAVCLNSLIGIVLGLITGYYGGKIDNILMRIIEIWNSIPFILLAIVIMSTFGANFTNLLLVVSLTGIMGFVRVVRSSVLLIKEKDYILAAKVMGIPNYYIIFKHILPNCVGPIIVLSTLRIGDIILTVAGLSFLGLGIQPPAPSWGSMLSSGQQYLSTNLWLSAVPGVFILLTVFGFNLFGDGLRDALDTKLKD